MELENKNVKCPTCGSKLDASTCITDKDILPEKGDLSICVYCGTLLEYEDNQFVHELSEDSLYILKITDPEIYFTLLTARREIISRTL